MALVNSWNQSRKKWKIISSSLIKRIKFLKIIRRWRSSRIVATTAATTPGNSHSFPCSRQPSSKTSRHLCSIFPTGPWLRKLIVAKAINKHKMKRIRAQRLTLRMYKKILIPTIKRRKKLIMLFSSRNKTRNNPMNKIKPFGRSSHRSSSAILNMMRLRTSKALKRSERLINRKIIHKNL